MTKKNAFGGGKQHKKSSCEQTILCDFEQVTFGPQLEADSCLASLLQIWCQTFSWGDGIRKSADLERLNYSLTIIRNLVYQESETGVPPPFVRFLLRRRLRRRRRRRRRLLLLLLFFFFSFFFYFVFCFFDFVLFFTFFFCACLSKPNVQGVTTSSRVIVLGGLYSD